MTLKEAFPEVAAPAEVQQPAPTVVDSESLMIVRQVRELISDFNNWTAYREHRTTKVTEGVFIRRKVAVDQYCLWGAFHRVAQGPQGNRAARHFQDAVLGSQSVVNFNDQDHTRHHHKKVLAKLDAYIAMYERQPA